MDEKSREIWEPNAMQKFAMEKSNGVVIDERIYVPSKNKPDIKVTISIDGEIQEFELDTIFFIGLEKGGLKQTGGQEKMGADAIVSGELGIQHCLSMVNAIHTIIENTPPLFIAEESYMLKKVMGDFKSDKD